MPPRQMPTAGAKFRAACTGILGGSPSLREFAHTVRHTARATRPNHAIPHAVSCLKRLVLLCVCLRPSVRCVVRCTRPSPAPTAAEHRFLRPTDFDSSNQKWCVVVWCLLSHGAPPLQRLLLRATTSGAESPSSAS